MLKILHLSDIHLGSGFSHGRINPETGLNSRLEDFDHSLGLCIDRAIHEPVDLVLFTGDAFPDATPAPYIQQCFGRQFRRLADHDIAAVLVVGNHDQHSQGNGGASLAIYRTLGVPGFIVGDRVATHRLETAHGPIQVVVLPWLNQSALLTKPETAQLTLGEINQLLNEKLTIILEAEIRKLDPNIPTILAGHLMAERSVNGSEKLLAVGKGFQVPLNLLSRPEFKYVALGHVHKHQNLNSENNPPIVYAGSIERVDFGEEQEEKGYVLVTIDGQHTEWQFCPIPARPFISIKVDVTAAEEPLMTIMAAIAAQSIEDAVVRLIYTLRSEQLDLIDNKELCQALAPSHSFSIHPHLKSQLARPRLPELGVGQSLDPISALTTYLDNREDIQELAPAMLEAAKELLSEIS
jgi:exonuclease SbcD